MTDSTMNYGPNRRRVPPKDEMDLDQMANKQNQVLTVGDLNGTHRIPAAFPLAVAGVIEAEGPKPPQSKAKE